MYMKQVSEKALCDHNTIFPSKELFRFRENCPDFGKKPLKPLSFGVFILANCWQDSRKPQQIAHATTPFPSTRSYPMQAFWNERFGHNEYAYGKQPNQFFRDELLLRKPGTILLPGEGEGRNAVFAAEQGWNVDAIDWSESGRQKALRLAAERGVAINYQVAQFEASLVRPGKYDACGVVFFHLEPGLMREAFSAMIRGLRAGGVLIAELYEKKQLAFGTGGPRSEDLLYTSNQIRTWVEGEAASILTLEEREVELQEGAYHSGPSAVLRLVAQRLVASGNNPKT